MIDEKFHQMQYIKTNIARKRNKKKPHNCFGKTNPYEMQKIRKEVHFSSKLPMMIHILFFKRAIFIEIGTDLPRRSAQC
jgi:hypothetical protein